MTKLETLYDDINQDGIDVVDAHFSNTKKAVCMHGVSRKVIVLDKQHIECEAEEGVLLAEEAGHYKTGGLYLIEATYNMPVARSNRIKYEAGAKKWAITKHLPPQEITAAIRCGCQCDYEVAEYCEVTVEFLHAALEYYKSVGIQFCFSEI